LLIFVNVIERMVLFRISIIKVESVHKEVSWVVELRTLKAEILVEIFQGLRVGTLVNNLSLCHEHQFVKHRKNLCIRLVNGKYDCFALRIGDLSQIFHNYIGSERI